MSDDQKFPDCVLRQRLELVFSPAENWVTCTMPLTTSELVKLVMSEQGAFFDEPSQIILLMETMDFRFEFIKEVRKGYWLLNPPVVD